MIIYLDFLVLLRKRLLNLLINKNFGLILIK